MLTDLPLDLRAAILPAITEAVLEHANEMAEAIGPDFEPGEFATVASEWAENYTFDLVRGIDNTTRTLLQRAVSQYQATPGMTREQLEALLRPAFGAQRAEAIAVTEITRSASQGVRFYQGHLAGHGIEMERVWNTNRDEKVCVICNPLNRKPESEWAGDYPDGPPAHPRCRCSVTLRVRR